jgi:hypothetical protein
MSYRCGLLHHSALTSPDNGLWSRTPRPDDKSDDNSHQQAIHVGGTEIKFYEQVISKQNILGQRRGRQGSHVASTMKFWLNERRTGVFMRNVFSQSL